MHVVTPAGAPHHRRSGAGPNQLAEGGVLHVGIMPGAVLFRLAGCTSLIPSLFYFLSSGRFRFIISAIVRPHPLVISSDFLRPFPPFSTFSFRPFCREQCLLQTVIVSFGRGDHPAGTSPVFYHSSFRRKVRCEFNGPPRLL